MNFDNAENKKASINYEKKKMENLHTYRVIYDLLNAEFCNIIFKISTTIKS